MNRIEFIGLPGSGKSTLTTSLLKEIDKNLNIDSYYRYYQIAIVKHYKDNESFARYLRFKLINKFMSKNHVSDNIFTEILSSFCVKHYKSINEIIKLVQLAPKRRREFLVQFLLKDIFRWEVIKKHPNRTNIIMEEGFIHRLLNIYVFTDNTHVNDTLFEFLESVQLPRALVYIEQDIEVVFSRMSQRKKGIPRGLRVFNEEELIEVLERMIDTINYIVTLLENKNVKVIRIKNNDFIKSKNLLIREIETLIE